MDYKISTNTVIDDSRNGIFVNATMSNKLELSSSNSGRPGTPATGTIRWNDEFNIPEIYTGSSWKLLNTSSIEVPLTSSTTRAIFFGAQNKTGQSSAASMSYTTIGVEGRTLYFGDLSVARGTSSTGGAVCSSSTRGVYAGGVAAAPAITATNAIDYITIATTGNATDFGDLVNGGSQDLAACSSSTRGVFGGGLQTVSPTSPIFQSSANYITIATTGNALNFGQLTVSRYFLSACSSPTRGVFGGGTGPSPSVSTSNIIDYITIATTGNATDFGDLTVVRECTSACSSSTRGVFGTQNGNNGGNVIDYITIATTGNATDFGDLDGVSNTNNVTAASSNIYGCFSGLVVAGETNRNRNTYNQITIATTGNATKYTDLFYNSMDNGNDGACSANHGGLQ